MFFSQASWIEPFLFTWVATRGVPSPPAFWRLSSLRSQPDGPFEPGFQGPTPPTLDWPHRLSPTTLQPRPSLTALGLVWLLWSLWVSQELSQTRLVTCSQQRTSAKVKSMAVVCLCHVYCVGQTLPKGFQGAGAPSLGSGVGMGQDEEEMDPP